jgi:hypothetical protein
LSFIESRTQPGMDGSLEGVVQALLEDIEGDGHHVYMDSRYTSLQAMDDLKAKGFYVTGTLNPIRAGAPSKEIAALQADLVWGEHSVLGKDAKDILLVADASVVTIATNGFPATEVGSIVRKDRVPPTTTYCVCHSHSHSLPSPTLTPTPTHPYLGEQPVDAVGSSVRLDGVQYWHGRCRPQQPVDEGEFLLLSRPGCAVPHQAGTNVCGSIDDQCIHMLPPVPPKGPQRAICAGLDPCHWGPHIAAQACLDPSVSSIRWGHHNGQCQTLIIGPANSRECPSSSQAIFIGIRPPTVSDCGLTILTALTILTGLGDQGQWIDRLGATKPPSHWIACS